jgi:hypothetical protein
MITPEMINPIIPGIFIFFNKIGDNKIMKSINEKINTGLLSGNSNSCKKCLKNSIIVKFYLLYAIPFFVKGHLILNEISELRFTDFYKKNQILRHLFPHKNT